MKNQIIKSLIFQYVLGGLYLIAVGLFGEAVVFSAFVGCIAGLIPNTYFGMRMLKQSDNNEATQWLGYAIRFEFGKWLMMGLIFALAFISDHEWDPVFLFCGFCLVILSGRFAPLILKGD